MQTMDSTLLTNQLASNLCWTYRTVGLYHKSMNIQAEVDLDDGWIDSIPGTGQSTRKRILIAAYHEIHFRGYQAASIQSIIDQAGVTKGALYHHFKSKHDVVLALIDEIYTRYVEETFIQPLEAGDDPISALIGIVLAIRDRVTDQSVALGCPLDNLAQEMTPIDESVRQRVEQLYQRKLDTLVKAFKLGQARGTVRADMAAESLALMVSATLQGCMSIAQSARSVEALTQCGQGLILYLQQLREETARAGSHTENNNTDDAGI